MKTKRFRWTYRVLNAEDYRGFTHVHVVRHRGKSDRTFKSQVLNNGRWLTYKPFDIIEPSLVLDQSGVRV